MIMVVPELVFVALLLLLSSRACVRGAAAARLPRPAAAVEVEAVEAAVEPTCACLLAARGCVLSTSAVMFASVAVAARTDEVVFTGAAGFANRGAVDGFGGEVGGPRGLLDFGERTLDVLTCFDAVRVDRAVGAGRATVFARFLGRSRFACIFSLSELFAISAL